MYTIIISKLNTSYRLSVGKNLMVGCQILNTKIFAGDISLLVKTLLILIYEPNSY